MDEQALETRLRKLEDGHKTLSHKVDANTVITQQIKTDTAELVFIFKAAGEGIRSVVRVGKGVRWFAGSLIAISTIYYFYIAFKSGHLPLIDPR